jgi:hypothetical protein
VSWTRYLEMDRGEVLERYAELAQEIAGRSEEVGRLQAEEKEERARGWRQSAEETVSGRERDAAAAALTVTSSLLRCQGELAALCEERDFLKLVFHAAASD